MAVCPELNQTIQTRWCAKSDCKEKNLSEVLTLHTGTRLPGYFGYLHGLEMDSRNREMALPLPFPQHQIIFFLVLTIAGHDRFLLLPHYAAAGGGHGLPTDPTTKGYSFPSSGFCIAWLQNCGTRGHPKTICTTGQLHTREDGFAASNELKLQGEDDRYLWKEQGRCRAKQTTFGTRIYHSLLTRPPRHAHPPCSTQVSPAL